MQHKTSRTHASMSYNKFVAFVRFVVDSYLLIIPRRFALVTEKLNIYN